MAYMVIPQHRAPPTPEERAREFWDAVQKLSAFFSLIVAIRSLTR
jgi:hypothetical protein